MTCSGSVLTNPELNVMNKMVVDCSRAGANVLFVAVLGPGGQEQVHVKHKEDNKFLVEFMMKESGKTSFISSGGTKIFLGLHFYLRCD